MIYWHRDLTWHSLPNLQYYLHIYSIVSLLLSLSLFLALLHNVFWVLFFVSIRFFFDLFNFPILPVFERCRCVCCNFVVIYSNATSRKLTDWRCMTLILLSYFFPSVCFFFFAFLVYHFSFLCSVQSFEHIMIARFNFYAFTLFTFFHFFFIFIHFMFNNVSLWHRNIDFAFVSIQVWLGWLGARVKIK